MNMVGFKWTSATCLVWVVMAGGVHGQSPQIALDANSVGPVCVIPENSMEFAMSGPDGAPFALLVSVRSINLATQSGVLVPDPTHPDANIVFDGFDPGSSLATTSVLNGFGQFTVSFVPFPSALGTYEPSYFVQALTVSQTTPTGLILTNNIVVHVTAPPPSVTHVTPNVVQCAGQVTVLGSQFPVAPSLLSAEIDGLPISVSYSSPGHLTLSAPASGRSGPLRVTSPAGSSAGNPDSLSSWIAVMPGATFTPSTAPSPITFPCAIQGIHSRFSPIQYAVALGPGDELFAELYVYDPISERITGESNPSVAFYDPVIKVFRQPSQPVMVVFDDDSGPAASACIGTPMAPRYIAATAETVLVQVDSWNGLSGGHFLLIIGARTPENIPLTISSVHPNRARQGDIVTVFGSGFQPKSMGLMSVSVGGMPCFIESVNINCVTFVVPDGAFSGGVEVTCDGETAAGTSDAVDTFLAVTSYQEFMLTESSVVSDLASDTTYRGNMDFVGDMDDFEFTMIQNQVLTFELYAYDATGERIIDTSFLAQGPADMEFRIYNPAVPYFPLLTQANDGPGFNAVIGPGYPVSGFTAPYTGTYRLRITTFFGWSVGQYLATAHVR